MGRKLVVDVSIAQAQEKSTFPTSKNCRDLLIAILESNHRVVFTPDISEEWSRSRHDVHVTAFASKWRAKMYARRKVEFISAETLEELLRNKMLQNLRAKIAVVDLAVKNHEEWVNKHEAMNKDCHLLEAAALTDEIVLSLDDKARELFTQACVKIGEIRAIVWANPDSHHIETLTWLKAGAAIKIEWQLGHKNAP